MLRCCDLKCEYLKNPIGLDVACPRFSYKIMGDKDNLRQTAYEIIVDGMWESGKVKSDRSVHIAYGGKPLSPFTKYTWCVRAFDNYGEVSEFAEGSFETGVMSPENFKGNFITTGESREKEVCPTFRKNFTLNKKVTAARIYATALGVYEISVNGKRAGDLWLTPGFTSYDKQLQYQTYDVTEMLSDRNVLCVTLGKGWYCGRISYQNNRDRKERIPAVLLMLRVTYDDKSVEEFVTDESFKWFDSQIIFSDIYDGETYNAALENDTIQDYSFDDTNLKAAKILDYPKAHITAQINEPIRITEEIKPVKIIKTPKGETVIDFGQNMVGWASFKVSGKKGERVSFTHAEVLDKDGNFYTENMRSAKNTVTYILKGEGEETYHPHFTFQGFRYIRIDEFPLEVTLDSFTGLVIHSDMERTGSFECSNEEINKLYQNALYGQKGNFLDVPTDCPQRDERLGWTGDAEVFIKTAALNMNVAPFFTKWLRDLSLDQSPTYGVPNVIPDVFHNGECSAAWGDAATICPYEIYKAFGDRRILEKQYDSMKMWVEYIRKSGDNEYLWNTKKHFGDWLALDAFDSWRGATAKDLIATAFYSYSTEILYKTAKILGYKEEEQEYKTLYKNIVKAFKEEFVTKTGRLVSNTQTAYVLALYFNLTDHKKRAADILAEMIRDNDMKLTTGFVGTPFLCHVLSENGYPDIAYRLLFQTEYPSWLYSVRKGATTIWEHWDGIKPDGSFWSAEMNSYNHYAYGAIVDWMYTKICGINYDENCPGYKKIIIKPLVGEELSYARASLETMYGTLSSSWEKKGKKTIFKVTIPPNTSAEFIYPDGGVKKLHSGEHIL